MRLFNWEIINETNYDVTCDHLGKDIIIVKEGTNSQLAYLKHNSKEDIYTVDEKVHKVIVQTNTINKSITIYENVAP
ncbi:MULTISPECIES: hypothetical protein [Staphylococcus]|uniref:Uncharacterized protein n=1 Tax=Staphylococcus agnetis TaxID=985762 RepID=A0AAW9YXJ8_9STAP|nr:MULTISPECIES: hypothetical protein [Staphylococcus]NHM92100.1 hypothetical protein [Staphylococcus sp. 10602379]NJI02813.1 hypothetical protein [Staphylococcus agnetis]NJI13434.1 hypothetical protein [Staphylococcus agnetis]QIN23652.1 hypothetical protein GJE18_02420 [Staphylococcus agnetis]